MFESKKIFELGFAFLNVGEVNFHEGTIKQRSDYQSVAGVVNLAFSCELFIKCLLNLAGQELRGHKLECLWAKYRKVCGDEASKLESSVMNRLATNFTFEEMLQDDSEAFYNYRYFYDSDRLAEICKNPLKPQFLRVFAYELYGFLRKNIEMV